MEALEERGIKYIIALRRSKGGIDYGVFCNHQSEGHFFYAGRLIFYMLRRRIVENKLTDKLSTREAIRVLCRQRIVRLDDRWKLAEASSKDRAQLEALGIPIT